MTSLSFDDSNNSRPIAKIKGGVYKNKIVYLNEDFSSSNKPKTEINFPKYEKLLKDYKPRERTIIFQKLQEALTKNISPESLLENDQIKGIYEQIISDNTKNKCIKIESNSTFEILPTSDPNKIDYWYIAGQTGSGKSYISRQIIESYHKMYKDRGIYLISKLSQDDTLDASKAPIQRINPESFLIEKPEMDEFANSLVIFDDYENFDDTKERPLGRIVYKLIEDIATMGRHHKTSLITSGHNLTNYKKSRLMLGECNYIVVFPHGASAHGLKYLLGTHVGLDKKQIQDLKTLGRYCMIHKNWPSFLLSAHEIKLLH